MVGSAARVGGAGGRGGHRSPHRGPPRQPRGAPCGGRADPSGGAALSPRKRVGANRRLSARPSPAVVARQLATIAPLAPGRVQVRRPTAEMIRESSSSAGSIPAGRGARTTEALRCVRLLVTGEEVDFRGRFFELQGALRPARAPAISVLVGGGSDAALARAGRRGDGWLALWVWPRRFEEALGRIESVACKTARPASPGSTRFGPEPVSASRARQPGSG